ncbi:glomulin-like [Lampetra planeri]
MAVFHDKLCRAWGALGQTGELRKVIIGFPVQAEETLVMKEDQLNDVVQRWLLFFLFRDGEDLTADDYQLFEALGRSCLAQGDSGLLLKCLQDARNQTCSPDHLVPVFLQLIEDIDPGAISETIVVIVPHLLTGLLRLQEGQAPAVGSVLSSLHRQMARLPVPYAGQQEEADAYGLGRCCTSLAAFTKTLVDEVKRKDGNCDSELKTELLKFCMRSLKEPLLEAELTRDRKSSLWLFAAEIMVTLPALQQTLSDILFFSSVRKSPLTAYGESRACLAYLLFVQLIAMETFPAVYSPQFVLQCNMDSVAELLSSKKESHLLKGLELYERNLESLEDDSLPSGLLELKSFYSVSQNLQQLLAECPIRRLREPGLHVLQLFINKLDVEAKHKFFRCMLKTSSHPGVNGFIVKNIRNQVQYLLQLADTNRWFLGEEFVPLLELLLRLPQAAETDLLHNMDQIMESLNLLRYLLIRDKETRISLWSRLSRIKDQYVKTLRVCLSVSRTYYSSELKALREKQKLKVLQSALVTFDLMESLIIRIEELTEEKLKISNH